MESWAKLKSLKGTSLLPWLAIRDFNEITGLIKKEGRHARPRRQMENITDAINHCGFREVAFIGPKYTWWYQRSNGKQIRERLDRALATKEWMDLFPTTKLHHLSSSASDHSPLSLHLVLKKKQKKMINALVCNESMEGIAICRGGPKLSHIHFAYDNLIFCKESLAKCDSLQKVLDAYEQVSRQQQNRTKTSLFFSSNTPKEIQEEIKRGFGAQVIK